jgi:hypothetical protein
MTGVGENKRKFPVKSMKSMNDVTRFVDLKNGPNLATHKSFRMGKPDRNMALFNNGGHEDRQQESMVSNPVLNSSQLVPPAIMLFNQEFAPVPSPGKNMVIENHEEAYKRQITTQPLIPIISISNCFSN